MIKSPVRFLRHSTGGVLKIIVSNRDAYGTNSVILEKKIHNFWSLKKQESFTRDLNN